MLYNLMLNKVVLGQGGMDLDEAVALIAIQFNLNLNEAVEKLAKKGLIGDCYFEGKKNGKYFTTEKGVNFIKQNILVEGATEKFNVSKNRLEELAIKMREIYPSGKKPGTDYYWRSNVPDIKKKLDSFFKVYGDKYSDSDILRATQNYVNSYARDNKYMLLLNYFIWKEKGHYEGGLVSRNSELANRLENLDDVSISQSVDWTSNIK